MCKRKKKAKKKQQSYINMFLVSRDCNKTNSFKSFNGIKFDITCYCGYFIHFISDLESRRFTCELKCQSCSNSCVLESQCSHIYSENHKMNHCCIFCSHFMSGFMAKRLCSPRLCIIQKCSCVFKYFYTIFINICRQLKNKAVP